MAVGTIRTTKGRFETQLITPHTTPAIRFRYKQATVKQYLKGHRRRIGSEDQRKLEPVLKREYELGRARRPGSWSD